MSSIITAHIWQSTLFAAAAGLLTLALKKNRARTRYCVWFIGLVKFLAPFGLLVSLGSHVTLPRWTPKAPVIVAPAISFMMGDAGTPVLNATVTLPKTTNDHLPTILFGAWACGFVAIAFCWGRRWTRIYADVRRASRLPINVGIPVMSLPVLREPGVFGIFRSVLLLPEGMAEHLSKAEWDAILAHEMCHVRCRDNLTAVIYMLVESVFWFHPLVWWMGTRLVAERERACDEEVLQLGSEPKIYAEGILKVCELYLASPLECVAGVTGSNLRERIRAIMTHRGAIRMSIAKKLLLAAAGTLAVTLPIVVGGLHAQSAPRPTPKWEAATIRPCEPAPDPSIPRGIGTTPGRLNVRCMPAMSLIQAAYSVSPDASTPVSGGPSWINSDLYDIEAKAEGNPSRQTMAGPMLRELLEDRFKLKIRRETKEVPVYELKVAKGGLKLQPFKEGSCIARDASGKVPPLAPGQKFTSLCGGYFIGIKGSNLTVDANKRSMTEFSRQLHLDRPVIDKTGIAGVFNFHLEFAPDGTTAGFLPPGAPIATPSDDPTGPSIFTAVQEQLGLKLESAKGPGELLIIDHIERPSAN